jgi:hypothetical protein
MRPSISLSLLLAVIATGCAPDPSASSDAGSSADALAVPVTYYGDVRPILAARCLSCHTGDGIAPFALDSYDLSRAMAARIALATRERRMPPFLADGSGSCQTYATTRWLSERELDVLDAWSAQGAPEGDPSTLGPTVVAPPTLTPPVATLDTGVDYTPSTAREDDYRCFVVEAPIATGPYFVTGSEMHPGNARIAHHAIVYAPTNDAQADAARALDETEDGPGYTCFGGAGVRAMPVALWAPGAGATLYPTGTGVQLEGGRPLIIQIHYNTHAAPGTSDRSHFDLQTVTSGVTPAYWVPIADTGLVLPPHMSSAGATASAHVVDLTRLTINLHAYGTAPHMHTLGRSTHVSVTRDGGEEECLLELPRWDFHWQQAYFYERPIPLAPTDLLTITCDFDTSSRSETTTWGEGTSDEMCIDFLYLSL